MTIRFAPATTSARAGQRVLACRPIARALAARALERVANEDASPASPSAGSQAGEQVLHAALRHFAEHGMGAARAAGAQAESAYLAGDRQGYEWWLGITRTLDRRLAAKIERIARSPAAPADQPPIRPGSSRQTPAR